MKKNHIIAAALAILLAGCSAENTASTSENVTDTSTESVASSAETQASDADEKAPEQNSNGELVKVLSYDGKTLTGTKLDIPAMGGTAGHDQSNACGLCPQRDEERGTPYRGIDAQAAPTRDEKPGRDHRIRNAERDERRCTAAVHQGCKDCDYPGVC